MFQFKLDHVNKMASQYLLNLRIESLTSWIWAHWKIYRNLMIFITPQMLFTTND